MTILIGKPENVCSSAYKVWQEEGENAMYISHGSYSGSIKFWSINNCMLGISIDISIGTSEYIELSGLMSNPDDINEEDINIYATSLILKYIEPSKLLICIENESFKQFRRGQENKIEEIKLAMSRLGFEIT